MRVNQMDQQDKCIIFGAGEQTAYLPRPQDGDLVIAADGGYNFAFAHGIRVDLIIGDFDSLGYRPEGVEIIELEVEKDDTDMFAAIKIGMGRGYSEFHIFGGAGGRLDHTIANIQLLAFLAQKDKLGFLYTQDSIVGLIYNSSMTFDAAYKGTVSVFSYSPASYGVTIKGMKYSLYDSMLSNILPLGVSNSFIGEASEISVSNGMLMIMFPYADEPSFLAVEEPAVEAPALVFEKPTFWQKLFNMKLFSLLKRA